MAAFLQGTATALYQGEINMINLLKKDYNKPRQYNTGVKFMRIALVMLVLAGLALLWRISYEPPQLTAEGKVTIVVNTLDKNTSSHHTAKRLHYNTLCFLSAENTETGDKYMQELTSDEYGMLTVGQQYEKYLYKTKSGTNYLSITDISDVKKASEYYYDLNPTAEMVSRNYVIGAAGVLVFLNAVIGLCLILKTDKQQPAAAVKQLQQFDDIFDGKNS